MNYSRIFLILLGLLLLADFAAHAQKRLIRMGNQAFEAGEYHSAAEKLKKAYGRANDRSVKGELAFKMGVSYMRMNQPNYARNWLRTATVYRYKNPKTHLYYAQTLMKLKSYGEAQKHFEQYAKLVPDDSRGEIGVKSIDKIKQWQDNPARYKVNEVDVLNSRTADFAPDYAGGPDLLYFTSARETSEGDKLNEVSGNPYTDIFYSMKDRKGDWSEPTPAKGEVNTEYDEGVPCLVDDGFMMFYTGCKLIKNKDMGCKIYTSELNGQEWSEPSIVELFQDSSISVGHPAVTQDLLTMYFASDYPGGKGGKDIWVTTRETPDDPWQSPKNMGDSINTQGDELYPFIHPNGTLYFSSNGRIGMGGLDIFKAEKNDDDKWVVSNMRPPINSQADDFGIAFEMNRDRGLFSSSRGQRGGIDRIFSFSLPPLEFNLVGAVVERETDKPLQDANVKIYGSNGTIREKKSGKEGQFKFELDKETDYRLVTTKKDYLKGKGKETTRGLEESKTLRMTITMAPIDKPIELPNILYDLNSAELRPESMVALDELVTTLNDNPKITIELAAHTDFRDSEEYNQDLSQRRAQSVVDYLIEKGIDKERLTARGYGESTPKTVSESLAGEHDFLPEGQVLNEEFIKGLPTQSQKEVAHQVNRRTEFLVLSTDYQPDKSNN